MHSSLWVIHDSCRQVLLLTSGQQFWVIYLKFLNTQVGVWKSFYVKKRGEKPKDMSPFFLSQSQQPNALGMAHVSGFSVPSEERKDNPRDTGLPSLELNHNLLKYEPKYFHSEIFFFFFSFSKSFFRIFGIELGLGSHPCRTSKLFLCWQVLCSWFALTDFSVFSFPDI